MNHRINSHRLQPRLAVAVLAALFALSFVPCSAAERSADLEALSEAIQLSVARNGSEVIVSWKIPPVSVKGLDVWRHTQAKPSGRTRLDFVSPDPAIYSDTVPDAKATYWYWIKVVFTDGRFVNIGPMATPNGNVWTP